MRISEAAQVVGVHPITLRRLERQGLICVPKDRNGQRRYSPEDIERIIQVYYPSAPRGTAEASHPVGEPVGGRV
jgi:predicted site-specific integrase-resolvase